MTKLLTVKRGMFFVAFLALALVGMTIPPVQSMEQESAVLYEDDMAYAETNSTVMASDGYYNGSAVTFGVEAVSVSETTIANGPAAEGVDYQSSAGCVAEGLDAGAANASSVTVDTSGHSLPLQSDTYLPVYVTGTYDGTDVDADTSWNGTVLAHAGFSTDNPDLEMADSSVSLGYTYDDSGGGVEEPGDPGCRNCEIQPMYSASSFRFGGTSFLPLAVGTKDKSYKITTKKWSAGETSFRSGKVRKWKSNVAGTENLDEVGVTVDTTAIQFDAASGTLNVKQKIRIKKAKKAAKKSTNGAA